jgi:hypothetical protein
MKSIAGPVRSRARGQRGQQDICRKSRIITVPVRNYICYHALSIRDKYLCMFVFFTFI